MFVLYSLKDTIEVDSEKLGSSFKDAVTLKLEQKFIGKVLQNEGIGVAIYELNIYDSKIKSDMILAHTQFSLILFQPFPGEVLTGRIVSSNHEGITVSLEFVEAFIPAACLAQPSS